VAPPAVAAGDGIIGERDTSGGGARPAVDSAEELLLVGPDPPPVAE